MPLVVTIFSSISYSRGRASIHHNAVFRGERFVLSADV
jgi:hypothetical protein